MLLQVKKKVFLTLFITILVLGSFQAITFVKASFSGVTYVIDDETNITDYLWSSDGTKIAYLKFPDGRLNYDGELWIADKAGHSAKLSNNRQITLPNGHNFSSLEDWHGEWILFHIADESGRPSSYYGRNDLWKIRTDGTGLTQITRTGITPNGIKTSSNPAYANRGTVTWARFIPGTDGTMVYMSAHNGNGWYNPYICTTDGSFHWQELGNPSSTSDNSFTIGISPTGNKLVWGDASYWNNPTTLRTSNADGSNVFTIKSFPHRTVPYVLADGYTITYRYVPLPPVPATREGNIYAINMDRSNDRTVLDDEFLNYPETYHPQNGQLMLMRSNRDPDGNWHFFSLNVTDPAADEGIVQLTEGPYNDEMALYSPDAQYLMYRRLPDDFDFDANSPPYPYQLVITQVPVWLAPGFSFISIVLILPVIALVRRRRKR
ncbi:MAG: TolB family protein [Candidatus Heimdallarchaeota archaeon]